jgi:hypothetical protein
MNTESRDSYSSIELCARTVVGVRDNAADLQGFPRRPVFVSHPADGTDAASARLNWQENLQWRVSWRTG